MDDQPSKQCRVCGQLKDRESATQKFGWSENDTHLPAAAAQLEIVRDLQPPSSRKLQIQRCPECQAYFLYQSDYEYLVNGSEDEEILTRLSAVEAQEYLDRPPTH